MVKSSGTLRSNLHAVIQPVAHLIYLTAVKGLTDFLSENHAGLGWFY